VSAQPPTQPWFARLGVRMAPSRLRRRARFDVVISSLSLATLLCTVSVHAQAPVPAAPTPEAVPVAPNRGPADIMNRANESRTRREVERAAAAGDKGAAQVAPGSSAPEAKSVPTAAQQPGTLPSPTAGHEASGTPPGPVQGTEAAPPPGEPSAPTATGAAANAATAPAQPPHEAHAGRDPHSVLAEPELPVAEPKRGLVPGTIEVLVVGPDGAPQPGAEIVLGVMASMGGRTEQRAKADAQGQHVFRGLAVGSQQAYRVNVLHEGAKFSTTPFRLPEELGYQARMTLRPTTTDTKLMFQVIGQTVVELRDDRLHITQQARLANAGDRVIAFPKDGLVVPLPEGFTAFQWQDQMTDQKGEELAGKGFRIRGSLPPGSVTLAWTFDLQRDGNSAKITVNQPFRTYTYRVISEAPEGLKLRATDFPEAERVEDNNRWLLFTQLQRAPTDAPLASFTIRLDGIPGPGPGRWIATALALLMVALGLTRAFKRDDGVERKLALEQRKAELIALAKQVDAEHERGEIGPNYRGERLDEIAIELAMVLRDEEALGSKASKGKPAQPAPAGA
jgi:hypothetical protein